MGARCGLTPDALLLTIERVDPLMELRFFHSVPFTGSILIAVCAFVAFGSFAGGRALNCLAALPGSSPSLSSPPLVCGPAAEHMDGAIKCGTCYIELQGVLGEIGVLGCDPTRVTPVVINWIANAKRRSAQIIRGLSAAMAKYLAFLLIALARRGRVRCVPERVT